VTILESDTLASNVNDVCSCSWCENYKKTYHYSINNKSGYCLAEIQLLSTVTLTTCRSYVEPHNPVCSGHWPSVTLVQFLQFNLRGPCDHAYYTLYNRTDFAFAINRLSTKRMKIGPLENSPLSQAGLIHVHALHDTKSK
jgi:hypothetical protein